MKLGIGIITHLRPQSLIGLLSSIYSSGIRAVIQVVDTSPDMTFRPDLLTYTQHLRIPMGEEGLTVFIEDAPGLDLPLARDVAETSLIEAGCERLIILDDDLVMSGDYLKRCAALVEGVGLNPTYIYGGALRTPWKAPGLEDDVSYLRWLQSSSVVPGGMVVGCTACYHKNFAGAWKHVHDMGVRFQGEDQCWAYTVHDRGAKFHFCGWVGLHAPPTRPEHYDPAKFKEIFATFMKNHTASKEKKRAAGN